MTPHETVELTLDGVVSLLQAEVDEADAALHRRDFDAALDGHVAALGLALQLGPAPTERVLRVILSAAEELAGQAEADSLSALGPAVVGLVDQVREAGVLPQSPAMDAWATVAADLGALIAQIGLALAVAPQNRVGMLERARTRAALLDDATGTLFCLVAWLDRLALS